MPTRKQSTAARRNVKKAQRRWRTMTTRQRSLAQPQGRSRAKPGAKGGGDNFRIVVRPKSEFTTFRYHDVGRVGHIQRLAGRRPSGSWSTQSWLISKSDARTEDGRLIPRTADARKVIAALGSKPRHLKGDVFEASDCPNVPEARKPAAAQKRARLQNIKKAQKARWK